MSGLVVVEGEYGGDVAGCLECCELVFGERGAAWGEPSDRGVGQVLLGAVDSPAIEGSLDNDGLRAGGKFWELVA